MSEFTPALVARILRDKSDAELAVTHPHQFQRWPARKVLKARLLADLIRNEKTRRQLA